MANTKYSGTNYRDAYIDTDPGSDGYFSDSVSPADVGKEIYLSIRDVGGSAFDMTVTVQFSTGRDGDTWHDHDTYTATTYEKFDVGMRSAAKWRIGVKNSADFTSGTIKCGFDWR
jgi:hypothetical protein